MDAPEEIGRYVMVIHRQLRVFLKRTLKSYDLNCSEAIVLINLCDGAMPENSLIALLHEEVMGKTQDQMNHCLMYDKSVMTRTMQSLEIKEYVTRKVNPQDSRSFIFSPTEKALKLIPILISTFKHWNSMLADNINKESLEAIKTGLSTMAENASNFMK